MCFEQLRLPSRLLPSPMMPIQSIRLAMTYRMATRAIWRVSMRRDTAMWSRAAIRLWIPTAPNAQSTTQPIRIMASMRWCVRSRWPTSLSRLPHRTPCPWLRHRLRPCRPCPNQLCPCFRIHSLWPLCIVADPDLRPLQPRHRLLLQSRYQFPRPLICPPHTSTPPIRLLHTAPTHTIPPRPDPFPQPILMHTIIIEFDVSLANRRRNLSISDFLRSTLISRCVYLCNTCIFLLSTYCNPSQSVLQNGLVSPLLCSSLDVGNTYIF